MKIAIVGTSINMTENEERDVRQFIAMILKDFPPLKTTIISGGAKGVDSLACEIALSMGFAVKEILPMGKGWKFNKVRNIEIADDCDKLFCISVPVHTQKCYHHKISQDHQKTAGCWTLHQASLKGREVRLLVTPQR